MKSYLIMVSISGLMVLFQNCSDQSFSSLDGVYKAAESEASTTDDLVDLDSGDSEGIGRSPASNFGGQLGQGGQGGATGSGASTSVGGGNSSQSSNNSSANNPRGGLGSNPVVQPGQTALDGLEICKGPTDVNCIKPPSTDSVSVCNGPDCSTRYLCVATDCFNQTSSYLKVTTPGSSGRKEVCMSKVACEKIVSQLKTEIKAVESTAKCGSADSNLFVHRTDVQIQEYIDRLK